MPSRRTLGRAFAVVAMMLVASSALAQIPGILPGQPKAPANQTTEATPPKADPRALAEAQLAEARRQQEAARLEDGSAPATDDLPANERQRLLDRLVLAYGERVNLIEESEKLKKSAADGLYKPAHFAEFSGPPPYPALRVDALRDEFELMRERLKHRESTRLVLESQKQGLIETQRRASEALRLAEDRLARAKGQAELDKEHAARERAALRLQLTEAELTNIDIVLESAKDEIGALERSAVETQRLVTRVLAAQTLSKEDVDGAQAKLRDHLAKLSAQIDRTAAENTRRLAEREKYVKSLADAANGAADRQLKLLDETLETGRMEMMSLRWLQSVVRHGIDGWGYRLVILGGGDAAARESAIAQLERIKADVATKRPLMRELEATEQEAVEQQELRLREALLDIDAAARESAILETQKARVQAIQRVELAVAKLDRNIGRWLDDAGVTASSDTPRDWKITALRAVEVFKQVWNFELFAVEDSAIVEGKTVTTSYGVTVGKSIGVLLLYALAYWLFAKLTRVLERLMVSRFKVDPQAASVARRWMMIAVSVVLIILILNLARIPLTAFAFMGGALAIGIGFGTQTIIKNVISGIIILFERKIRVGDIVAIGGTTGHVTAVDLRASTVRSFDGVEALVPNSTFLENQVVNWTYSNSRIRREIKIGIAYGSPVRQAAEVIAGCAAEHGQVLKDPPPEVYLEDFGDNAILMVLIFWVELSPTLSGRRVDSDLRFMMEKRLAAADIAIPFPQRDVHLDAGKPIPVHVVPPPEAGA
jgi:potassium-dependent mechanosensitive channel